MEGFQYLVDNVPSCLEKLQQLSRQVNERRTEFDRLSRSSGISTPPIRKHRTGSTESLRPIELDNDAYENSPIRPNAAVASTSQSQPPTTPAVHIKINPNSKRLFQEHRDRARRKRKSASLLSGTSGPQRFRSRMSFIVYYDSNIQEGFEWLVGRLTSAAHSLHKGKMAASHKSRLAALDMEESPFDGNRTDKSVRNPKIPRFQKSSTPFAVDSLALEPFEAIDEHLKAAQTVCELGAHQFLRDADCNDELATIKDHFEKSMEIAREQMQILKAEEERSKLLQMGSDSKQIGVEEATTPLLSSGVEIDNATSGTKDYGLNGMAVEIDDSDEDIEMDGRVEIEDTIGTSNRGGIDVDAMVETEDAHPQATGGGLSSGKAGVCKNIAGDHADLSASLVEIHNAPSVTKSGGFSNMVEIDDSAQSPEDNTEFKVDLAAFRRTRRR